MSSSVNLFPEFHTKLTEVASEVRAMVPVSSELAFVNSSSDSAPLISACLQPKHYLFGFEAAHRLKWRSVADTFLQKWQHYIDQKMIKKFGTVSHPSRNYALQETDIIKMIRTALGKRLFPSFIDIEPTLKKLYESLSHPMAKELLFRQYELENNLVKIPQHVEPLFHTPSQSLIAEYLVSEYSHLKTELHFPGDLRHLVTDSFIQGRLERLPNLKTLDLSGCAHLTEKCLSKGHKNLQVLVLNGIGFSKQDIKKKLFPKLEKVYQERYNFYLASSNIYSFASIIRGVSAADEVICAQDDFEALLNRCIDAHENQRIDVLKMLYLYRKKIKGLSLGSEEIVMQTSQALIKIWQQTSIEDWSSPWSQGPMVLQALIEIWKDTQSSTDPISLAFRKELMFWRALSEPDPILGIAHHQPYVINLTALEVVKIPYLLRALRDASWETFKEISTEIAMAIEHCSEGLFLKEQSLVKIGTRDADMVRIHLLLSTYVELSHHLQESQFADPKPFLNLQSPSKMTKDVMQIQRSKFFSAFDKKKIKKVFASQYFEEYTVQALAAAFSMHVASKELRQLVLWRILDNFKHHYTKFEYYSLPKIVLGVVNETDIPPWDTLLRDHLLNYCGVFKEDISDQLKEAYWNALCNGELDGLKPKLLEGLQAFSKGLPPNSPYKDRAIKEIQRIAQILKQDPPE